jgi:hypothetical protein
MSTSFTGKLTLLIPLLLAACSQHDATTTTSATPPAAPNTRVAQGTPDPSSPAPTNSSELRPSPQADDAAAAAPECKDSPMREQACRPGDTGNPSKK